MAESLGALMLTIAGERDHPPAWARGVTHPVAALHTGCGLRHSARGCVWCCGKSIARLAACAGERGLPPG
eukprot:2392857-Alexandrium_andersonii.AAC.1